MKQNIKRLSAVLLAMLLIVAMTVPVWASTLEPSYSDDYAWTTQPGSYYTTGDVTVFVDIQSKRTTSPSNTTTDTSFSQELEVTFTGDGSTSKRYTVADVLIALNKDTSNNVHFQDYEGNDIDYGDDGNGNFVVLPTSFYKAQLNGTTYGPTSLSAKNGWMFRINTQFPVSSYTDYPAGGTIVTDASGLDISQAYVKDNDVLSIYMDNPTSSSNCVRFSRIKSVTYTPGTNTGTLTITPQVSYDYFYGGTYGYSYWYMRGFHTAVGLTVELYSSKTSTTPLASATTGNDGKATITYELTSGTAYYIRVKKEFISGSKYIKTTRCLAKFTP